MLKEMAALGFERAELSHGIRISLVPGILKAVEEAVISIGSVHNFCPLPMGAFQAAPNFFQPSSADSREREQWLRQTKRTIDFAVQVGASLAVCHLGSVPYFWFEPGRPLEAYLEKHPDAAKANDKAFEAKVAKALAKIRRKMPPFWQNTQDSVKAALEYAQAKGIRLGLENRERIEELPIDADFPPFLASIPPPSMAGYWHDAGHAHLKERMGLISHRGQLEQNAGRLLGFHLHDVVGDRDHQPIGAGSIDFAMVSSFWREGHLLVIELSPRVEEAGVLSSKAAVEALLRAWGQPGAASG
jgi:sugar phosphate isomerase/epimerase